MILLLLLACDPPDACVPMCVAARERFAACLEEEGLEWGPAVGYADAADYDDWCATWAWELRQLGQADTCAARIPTFETGTCDDYHAAWETP